MSERILHLLLLVAVAWGVTFTLRAIPFILFAGRDREIPKSVERFGAIVSPVIITCLIVYSYAGLEWRTAWPYLAGALTIGLQLWKGNPLASILAGTVLYMVLLGCCGCQTSTVAFKQDIAHPLIHVTRHGLAFVTPDEDGKFKSVPVTPEEAVERLEDLGVPKTATIYVQVDDPDASQRALWVFKNNYLSRAGYTKSAWVTPRRAESGTAERLNSNLQDRKIPFEGRTFTPGQSGRTYRGRGARDF